jgi:hypothetical protein
MIKKLPVQIKALIGRHISVEKHFLTNRQYFGKRLLGNLEAIDQSKYENLKMYQEAEHQIGRYLNMVKVINEVEKLQVEGDVVEFGTWQGQGLSLIDKSFGKKTNRFLIGIDSFEGLPETSTIWIKGAFSNTSFRSVENYLDSTIRNCNGYSLIQGWFNDPKVRSSLYNQCSKVAIVHLDADLASSTTDALGIIENYLVDRKDPLFLMFDDWGCHPDEVPDAYFDWEKSASQKFNFVSEKFASTNLTRYYKLSFGAAQ